MRDKEKYTVTVLDLDALDTWKAYHAIVTATNYDLRLQKADGCEIWYYSGAWYLDRPDGGTSEILYQWLPYIRVTGEVTEDTL